MSIVHVDPLQGRPATQRGERGRELSDAAERVLGSDPERIQVLISELPGEAWMRGGKVVGASGAGAEDA